ncbi:MAG: hypothetical protein RLZZ166_266 [Pseudomonadota bacterium]|jgi:photosynthetic reaction center cytochrome c subunit
MKKTYQHWTLGLILGMSLVLTGCERPPKVTEQIGYRGTGMEKVINPRIESATKVANVAPEPLPPAEKGGKKASAVYKNVKVLGDLTENEFNRVMLAMTTWVAPEQGCTFCHNGANFADDSLYQKVVARKMIEMTTTINSKWQAHVGNTGVTCYTCHRGNNVPNKLWFTAPEVKTAGRMLGNDFGQNKAGQDSVKNASLPYDPFTPFLLKDTNIRVAGTTALPTGNKTSLKQAEYVHGLMIHMSDSLGANCTTCHNTRAMAEWDESTPQRTTAWVGIRMVRDLNNNFVVPLTGIQPAHRLGPTGDIGKVNCATCHNGVQKPLYGAPMLQAYPELKGSLPVEKVAAMAAPASAPKDHMRR